MEQRGTSLNQTCPSGEHANRAAMPSEHVTPRWSSKHCSGSEPSMMLSEQGWVLKPSHFPKSLLLLFFTEKIRRKCTRPFWAAERVIAAGNTRQSGCEAVAACNADMGTSQQARPLALQTLQACRCTHQPAGHYKEV